MISILRDDPQAAEQRSGALWPITCSQYEELLVGSVYRSSLGCRPFWVGCSEVDWTVVTWRW